MSAIRVLFLIVLGTCVCATEQVTFGGDVVIVSGDLAHHRATNELFHIDDLWMQVAPDTLFHRWLLDIKDDVTVILTRNPDRYGDRDNLRILPGRLVHETSPTMSPIVHMFFLKDDQTGTIGAVTFETDDPVTAQKFFGFDDQDVAIIIEVK